MGLMVPLFGAEGFAPAKTESAGTAITALIPPRENAYTRLLSLLYTVGTTAHNLYVLRELARTTASAAAAAAQKVVNLTANPGSALVGPNGETSQVAANAVAANDWLVFQLPDGTYWYDKVASISTLAVTMTTNFPTNGVAAGAIIWHMGIHTDSNPLDFLAGAHPKFTIAAAASGTEEVSLGGIQAEVIGGLVRSPKKNSPMLLYSDNGTVAGRIEHYTVAYSDR